MTAQDAHAVLASSAARDSRPPNVRRWFVELVIWIFLAWPAAHAVINFWCFAWLGLVVLWCALALSLYFRTIFLCARLRDIWPRVAVITAIPLALLLQWILYWTILAPESDASLMAEFALTRAELERQVVGSAPLRVVRWHRPAPLVINRALSKGFLHSETEPSPLVSNLDLYWVFRFKRMPLYRRLSGDWYLFLGHG